MHADTSTIGPKGSYPSQVQVHLTMNLANYTEVCKEFYNTRPHQKYYPTIHTTLQLNENIFIHLISHKMGSLVEQLT